MNLQSSRIQCQHTKISCISMHDNEQSEKEITKTMPCIIASKRIKCLGIHVTKDVKDFLNKTYESLLKEIKEDINQWKYILCSWIHRLNIVRMSV